MSLGRVSNTNKVINGLSSQTVITIVLGFLEIVSFSIMSRLLTDEDFGYYAAILAIVTVFQSFTETGIGSALIQRKELDNNYINSSFSMSLLFGVLISLALFLSAGVVARFVADDTMITPLRIMSITLLCNCLSSVNISFLQREMQFIKIGLINIISLVITTVIAIFLALKGLGYYAILTKGVLASIITLFLSFCIAKQRYRFVFDVKTYKQIFGFGGWLLAAAVFRNIASQVDRLLMNSLISIQALGLYTRPKEFISNIAGKCNSIFDTVLFPVLSSLQDQKEQLQRSFKSACYLLNLFAMLLAVLFFCNSELLIRVFFGEKWMNVNSLFKVLSFYPVLLVNGRMGDVFLRSLAMTMQQFSFRVGQLVFAVVFILAGYKFGLVAVALSVMVSYGCITAIKIGYVVNKMGITWKMVTKTVLSSYQFISIIAPLYLISRFVLPNTWIGNIIQLIGLLLVLAVLFIVFPGLVGSQYKNGSFAYVKSVLYSKFTHNDKSRDSSTKI